jgi:uncharacterized protein (TIGR03083 family)
VAAVERETEALWAALGNGPPDVAVPSCPDWTVVDLARHVGEFTLFWAHVLCEGTGRPKTPAPAIPEAPGSLGHWYRALAESLVGELRATAPETEIWTWVPDDKSARFAARRCAHELAIHRYDAQLARGTPEPIEPALAADGIEECLFTMAALPEQGERGGGERLQLLGTDGDGQWHVTLSPDGVVVDRRQAPADLTVRGTLSDLELLVCGRPTIGEVEKEGQRSVLDAWRRAFAYG